MKKQYFCTLLRIAMFMLGTMSCGKAVEEQEENGQEYFNAKVLAVYDNFVEVECLALTTGAITEGTPVSVTKNVESANGVPEMKVGDEIRVVFSGVLETYPPQLQTVWAIYALDEDGNIIIMQSSR